MERATARVVLQPMASRSGARTLAMAVAKKKATLKQREEEIPTPLFIPPQDRWGEMYYPHRNPSAQIPSRLRRQEEKILWTGR